MIARASTIFGHYGFTAEKMDRAITKFSKILTDLNCEGTFPITADALARQPALVEKYRMLPMEIGIHGYRHIDYRNLSREDQFNSIHKAQDIFRQCGLKPVGFRSPYLRWNQDTMTVLSESGFLYDSSQAFDFGEEMGLKSNAFLHALEFYGSISSLKHLSLPRTENGIVRIPYCLPDDEALIERFKLSKSEELAKVWLEILQRVYESGELFTLGIHPERFPICNLAIQAVINKAKSYNPKFWIARLDEVADWYLELGKVRFTTINESDSNYRIEIEAPEKSIILWRHLVTNEASSQWRNEYHRIFSSTFSFKTKKLPFLGISPQCPSSLVNYLRHQGYLIEISSDPNAYFTYIDKKTFSSQDERSLIEELEAPDRPVLRIWRWPEGAQAALAITGDVDAFTLWDYGLRVFNY